MNNYFTPSWVYFSLFAIPIDRNVFCCFSALLFSVIDIGLLLDVFEACLS